MNTFFLPRGIRNNNPGNIRLGKTPWKGQRKEQSDPDFAEFTDPVFGLRALMRLLLTYYCKYQLDTVQSIINRYAPPHENATDHYARGVARALKVRRTQAINVPARGVLVPLAAAIVRHENGPPPEGRPEAWYAPADYQRAADMALDAKS